MKGPSAWGIPSIISATAGSLKHADKSRTMAKPAQRSSCRHRWARQSRYIGEHESICFAQTTWSILAFLLHWDKVHHSFHSLQLNGFLRLLFRPSRKRPDDRLSFNRK